MLVVTSAFAQIVESGMRFKQGIPTLHSTYLACLIKTDSLTNL